MRTAADFNSFYATPDPWRISRARFRDKVLRRCLTPFVRGKSVLELGCGEGHLTQAVFGKARSVVGIDISDVAIDRARSLDLPNARFESADLLRTSFEGYDVIAAIECIYYLSLQERGEFLEKVATPEKCFCSRVRLSITDDISVISDWCTSLRRLDSLSSNFITCPFIGIRLHPESSPA